MRHFTWSFILQACVSFVAPVQLYYVFFNMTNKYIHFYHTLCLNKHHEANKDLSLNKMLLFTTLRLGGISSALYDKVIFFLRLSKHPTYVNIFSYSEYSRSSSPALLVPPLPPCSSEYR